MERVNIRPLSNLQLKWLFLRAQIPSRCLCVRNMSSTEAADVSLRCNNNGARMWSRWVSSLSVFRFCISETLTQFASALQTFRSGNCALHANICFVNREMNWRFGWWAKIVQQSSLFFQLCEIVCSVLRRCGSWMTAIFVWFLFLATEQNQNYRVLSWEL